MRTCIIPKHDTVSMNKNVDADVDHVRSTDSCSEAGPELDSDNALLESIGYKQVCGALHILVSRN